MEYKIVESFYTEADEMNLEIYKKLNNSNYNEFLEETQYPNRTTKSYGKMKQHIAHISILVKDYDEAIDFYTKKLLFRLIEDTYIEDQDKRWVLLTPPNANNVASLLMAKAANSEQEKYIGNQTGGRVFLFLFTDDFWRDYDRMKGDGVSFVREPKEESYGTVAVFEDLYGNLWDLLEPTASNKANF